ncbi:L-seryl-tRNA(Sec) kinase [Pseudorasbora parva]|uniref:L-seryl-tRNA(Sec) kinase n=1 Tax=Pseudorasbora parva TaxID=51549 RepID=UPI00351ED79B
MSGRCSASGRGLRAHLRMCGSEACTLRMAPARACLCVLCGLPAAGKSRLAQELRGHAHKRGWMTLLVTYDELIPARDWRETEWKQHRKTVLMCVERFLHQTLTHTLSDQTHTHTHSDQTHTHTLSDQTHTHTHTLSGSNDDVWMRFQQMVQQQNVSHTHTLSDQTDTHTHSRPLVLLLDDNFYYQSMRQQVQRLARKCSVGFCQLFLRCPLQVCVRRNQQRAPRIPEDVLMQVCERMEPPDPSRNHWEQQSLELDTTDHITHGDLQRLMELLASALENPLRPIQDESQQKEADRQICASSALHQADRTCRRLVSQAVASAREARASPQELQALVSELNELKTRVLQDLKRNPESAEQELLGFEHRTRQTLTRHLPDL